jgi:retinol dehydrogenase-12
MIKQRGATAATAAAAAASSEGAAAFEKVCVNTGANTGLGFISAGEIAKKPGYRVVMACRDVSRAEKAAADVLAATGHAVDVIKLDLSSLDSVDAFVAEFTGKYDRCDVLMNNAGVMALPERSLTVGLYTTR